MSNPQITWASPSWGTIRIIRILPTGDFCWGPQCEGTSIFNAGDPKNIQPGSRSQVPGTSECSFVAESTYCLLSSGDPHWNLGWPWITGITGLCISAWVAANSSCIFLSRKSRGNPGVVPPRCEASHQNVVLTCNNHMIGLQQNPDVDHALTF